MLISPSYGKIGLMHIIFVCIFLLCCIYIDVSHAGRVADCWVLLFCFVDIQVILSEVDQWVGSATWKLGPLQSQLLPTEIYSTCELQKSP